MTEVDYVRSEEDVRYLGEQRKAQKVGIGFDTTRSEVLFSRKALLVEGPGDQLAVRLVAQMIGKDPDAEDLAVVPCGSKSAIPFFARTCAALGIPFLVLHDEDIYPESGDDSQVLKIRKANSESAARNKTIAGSGVEELIRSVRTAAKLGRRLGHR